METVWWSQERENEKLLDEHSMEPDDLIVVPEPVIKNGNGDEEDDIESKKEFDAINEFESILRDVGGDIDLAVIDQLVKLNVRQVDQNETVQFYSDRVNQLEVTMAEKFDSVMARSRELEIENARLKTLMDKFVKINKYRF